jgi:hypothetical protein
MSVTLDVFLQQITAVRQAGQQTKLCTPVGVQLYTRVTRRVKARLYSLYAVLI